MKTIIDPDLAAFLGQAVMLVMAAKDVQQRPAMARGMGLRLNADSAQIDLLVSRAQWPGAILGLKAGSAIALTACNPADYQTFQIKGDVVEIHDADGDDLLLAEDYRDRIFTRLGALGVEHRQIACWLVARDLVRIRWKAASVFEQTPGQDAGQPRNSFPAARP